MRIAIIKSIIPSYREGFYDRLLNKPELNITIFCQEKIPGMNLRYAHKRYEKNVYLVKHITANGEEFSWQFLPWIKIFRNYDVYFIEGNPRNLSHVLIATFLRLCGKPVVLWTMGHSFRANMFTERIRLWWSRIFKFLFVYTDYEVEYLKERGFRKQVIIGMNNGLNQNYIDSVAVKWNVDKLEEWKTAQGWNGHKIILSSSRLVQKNRYDLLIKALPAVIERVPDLLWCIIGDGEQKGNMIAQLDKLGIRKYVTFIGEVYDDEQIAPFFLSADCLVHPEGIGLSILHAFGYGLPVITHGNGQLHGPEYAAFMNRETGYNYEQGNVADLTSKIVLLLQNDTERIQMKHTVKKLVQEKYNVDVMVTRFIEIAKMAANDNTHRERK